MRRIRGPMGAWVATAVVSIALSGCGGDNPVEPIDELQPFVGTWEAEIFTFTLSADPTVVERIIESGGTFTTNIQPSGNYTSTFTCCDLTPFVEFGRMAVNGSVITFTPQQGSPATSTFSFLADDLLLVEGQREWFFDFNPEAQPAAMRQELRRTN